MDPHKRSVTIEVIDRHEKVLTIGRYGTDSAGFCEMLTAVEGFEGRVWAIEGCNGIGRHLAHRLVSDGETVIDVPAKLSARVRVFATGNGRKTDPVDAHSVAVAALRAPNLRRVQADPQLEALGMLVDRRDELGRVRTELINRIHRMLLELVPGGAKRWLSARQARAMVAGVAPAGPAVRMRLRVVGELIDDLEIVDARIKTANKELRQQVAATGSTLMELPGIGPAGAARLLADVGDIRRFATRDRFASWNGTAPLDASSGDQTRHRLSRAGNRKINRALHIMAVVQQGGYGGGRDYVKKRKADGKTQKEALRALKRRLSNTVYTRMLADQRRREEASPGGQSGATTDSCATGSTPYTGPSDRPLPGPAIHQPNELQTAP
ncbi:IS110 family transposase [Nocardia sp. BMG51109]|uniref:IS110 family transposase n=1 Tax=Nocardia sp. BMG51109 TaxID=1056816 RepID=UPI00056B52AC|nr:IS110 family transposase [Nocardia sp. BMG51109]